MGDDAHGKNPCHLVAIVGLGTNGVPDQVGNLSFRLWRDSIRRACRQLSCGPRHSSQRPPRSGRGSLPLISHATPVFLILFWFLGPPLWAEELNIYLKTTPRVALLRPFADPVGMSLLVTGADGRPINQGHVDIRLDAPKPGRFFSTDFPFVEGTRLNEMHLGLRQGRANWNYLLPIRGEYRLAVDVVSLDGTMASKVFAFNIRENERKWFTLGGFSVGLFLLGFAAGRIFTQARSAAAVFIAVALLSESAEVSTAQEIIKLSHTAVLEVEPAKVGTATSVQWRLESESTHEKPTAFLTLTINHLEKSKIVFGVEKLPVAGEFSMKFQFPDGAEYRVVAIANIPGAPTIRNEQVVPVIGIEPPVTAMVPALSYFLALIVLGLGAGRWSKLRKSSA